MLTKPKKACTLQNLMLTLDRALLSLLKLHVSIEEWVERNHGTGARAAGDRPPPRSDISLSLHWELSRRLDGVKSDSVTTLR